MDLKVEVAVSQLNKHNEELCGDCVERVEGPSSIVVMADGLGSGVKAHILSSLTAKMAATMLAGNMPVEEVIDSIVATLPMCEVRHLAYSTFTMLQVTPDNNAYLVEYDNPLAFRGRGPDLLPVERSKKTYSGRTVFESHFPVQDGDWIVMISDGVLHAGIGGIWNLGWGWERIGDYLKRVAPHEDDARSLAQSLSDTTARLYAGKPGDDATVVAVQVRIPRRLTIFAGPPVKKEDDARQVERFVASLGKKAICGGTTGNMVARELGRRVEVHMSTLQRDFPPTGYLDGVDLVTEGILTLTGVVDSLKEGLPSRKSLYGKSDGPSRLIDLLLEADEVHFMIGRAINPAHQSPELPASLALKHRVIEDLCRLLEGYGKRVTMDLF